MNDKERAIKLVTEHIEHWFIKYPKMILEDYNLRTDDKSDSNRFRETLEMDLSLLFSRKK